MWHFHHGPCSPVVSFLFFLPNSPVVSLLCFIVGSSCAWLIYPTRLLIPWLQNSWLLMWLCWYVCHLPFPFTLEIGICLLSNFQDVLLQNQHPNFDFSTTFQGIEWCSLLRKLNVLIPNFYNDITTPFLYSAANLAFFFYYYKPLYNWRNLKCDNYRTANKTLAIMILSPLETDFNNKTEPELIQSI